MTSTVPINIDRLLGIKGKYYTDNDLVQIEEALYGRAQSGPVAIRRSRIVNTLNNMDEDTWPTITRRVWSRTRSRKVGNQVFIVEDWSSSEFTSGEEHEEYVTVNY